MFKLNDEVKVVDLEGTGLEGHEDEFLGKIGKIIYIDGSDNELPYSVNLDTWIGNSFYFHSIHLKKVGE